MSEAQAQAKSPRSAHSKSEPFEAGYAAFMADVFGNNVQSIETLDTDAARMLVLAGTLRLRLDKKTGLLHSERLTPGTAGAEGAWAAAPCPIESFWATATDIANALHYAWRLRLRGFVPDAKVCYPELEQASRKRGEPTAAERWDYALSQASLRRLGGRARRQSLVKLFVARLWNFLVDRPTLKLCHAYFGRKAALEDYNFTVRRRRELAARFQETPNLAPLIGAFLRQNSKLKTGRYRIPQDVLMQARAHLFAKPGNPEPLTPAGWRLLASLTPASVTALWQVAHRLEAVHPAPELSRMLNIVSKTAEQPPLALLKQLLRDLGSLRSTMSVELFSASEDSLVRFARLAGQQAAVAKKRGRLKRFVKGDLLLVWDWLTQNEHRYYYAGRAQPLASVPKNATWPSLMRAQQRWHEEREARERARRDANAQAARAHREQQDALTWPSALPACEVLGATVTPLVTGKALREEGERMRHCVGSYVSACHTGASRIFAIQHAGEDATLELVNNGGKAWRVRQLFGPKNCQVSKPVEAVATAITRLYQAAARESRA